MRVSAEARALARNIIDNQLYRENLLARATRGMLPPGVETMLWHYAFGKPPDVVDMQVTDVTTAKLQEMSDEELAARAQNIAIGIMAEKEREARARVAEIAREEEADQSFISEEPIPFDNVVPFKTH